MRSARFLTFVTASLIPLACAGLPESPPAVCEQIPGVPGPEDMLHGHRLLISSHDRRDWSREGDIFAYDLERGTLSPLAREDEPPGLSFRPHGIDISPSGDQLYVILHDQKQDGPWNGVAVYDVKPNALHFKRLIEDSLLTSPNDLTVLPDGSFYVTIDSVERNNRWNILLARKSGRILFCEKSGPCRIAFDHIAYPNGILATQDGTVFVTASREDRLYSFRSEADRSLVDARVIAEIPGGDNLERDDRDLLTTSHPSGLAFLRHMGDARVPSPSVIYRITPEGKTTVLLADDGRRISAASVALIYKGNLYLGQVFNPFLVRCRSRNEPRGHGGGLVE